MGGRKMGPLFLDLRITKKSRRGRGYRGIGRDWSRLFGFLLGVKKFKVRKRARNWTF